MFRYLEKFCSPYFNKFNFSIHIYLTVTIAMIASSQNVSAALKQL